MQRVLSIRLAVRTTNSFEGLSSLLLFGQERLSLLVRQQGQQQQGYKTLIRINNKNHRIRTSSHSNKTIMIQNLRLVRWMAIVLPITALASPYSSSSSSSSNHQTNTPIPKQQQEQHHHHQQKVVVVGGTHGNEYTGVWCIHALERVQDKLQQKYPSLHISTLLANPQAHLENKRFVQSDLNREFSKEKLVQAVPPPLSTMDPHDGLPATVESLRAKEIDQLLGPKFYTTKTTTTTTTKNTVLNDNDTQQEHGTILTKPTTDLIVDLHSTTSNMGLTIIIPEGDLLMAQAAAYVLHKCGGKAQNVRCLMHTLPKREDRPNLSSAAKHGFTIEVGPVPQGVLRHDAVEQTERAMYALFDFMQQKFSQNDNNNDLESQLQLAYPTWKVPCFRSAPARRPGEMSGKIPWPSHPDNPNFPAVMVHKSLQDRDFHMIRKGDALFVDLDGNITRYEGTHGDEVYLIFVNEGGYYYASSGTGIGVAVKTEYDLQTGRLLPTSEEEKVEKNKEKETCPEHD